MVATASTRTFEQIALDEPERKWELHKGEVREKPAMSIAHGAASHDLVDQIVPQLDRSIYDYRRNWGRARHSARNSYIPDVLVVPVAVIDRLLLEPSQLEVYRDPLPFVAEFWSPSTGSYDLDAKIPRYRERGDEEIWRVHPLERSVTAWQRQTDGSYAEFRFTTGKVAHHALPTGTIDLDRLFRFAR